jgi:hypothetical protein
MSMVIFKSPIQPNTNLSNVLLRDSLPYTYEEDGPKDGPNRSIRAGIIRRLLLDLPLTDNPYIVGYPRSTKLTSFGLKIVGATITEGPLDLENFGVESQEPISLIFEDCTFQDEINLSHAHLKRLSLENCHLIQLTANESNIDGDIKITRVTPLPRTRTGYDSEDQCGIKLRGTKINGNVFGEYAKLCGMQKLRKDFMCRTFNSDVDTAEYALNLRGACVDGLIVLQPGWFRANGGLSIRDAHIKGDIWACGAELIAKEEFAFNAQSAHIDGHLLLRTCRMDPEEREYEPFRASGCVWMYGVKIGGSLWMYEAELKNGEGRYKETSLSLTNAVIEADVKLCSREGMKNKRDVTFQFQSAKKIYSLMVSE